MSLLTREQKQTLATQLRQRERALYADIRREIDKSGSYGDSAGEVADAGDASVADLITDVDDAEIGRDIAELRLIGQALQRVQSDSYGVCSDCGTDIPFERLQAQPMAQRCVACQAAFERTHGQGGGPTL